MGLTNARMEGSTLAIRVLASKALPWQSKHGTWTLTTNTREALPQVQSHIKPVKDSYTITPHTRSERLVHCNLANTVFLRVALYHKNTASHQLAHMQTWGTVSNLSLVCRTQQWSIPADWNRAPALLWEEEQKTGGTKERIFHTQVSPQWIWFSTMWGTSFNTNPDHHHHPNRKKSKEDKKTKETTFSHKSVPWGHGASWSWYESII